MNVNKIFIGSIIVVVGFLFIFLCIDISSFHSVFITTLSRRYQTILLVFDSNVSQIFEPTGLPGGCSVNSPLNNEIWIFICYHIAYWPL